MAGCGDQLRGIANDNRLSIVGHLGWGNLSEFFYEPLSVGGDRGADFQTPLPPPSEPKFLCDLGQSVQYIIFVHHFMLQQT